MSVEGTSCGPDVTDWFVNIMNNAKGDKRVLEIKRRLEGAQTLGRRYGYNSQAVLEGGLVRKVLVAERNASNRARTTDAIAQIQAADPNNEFGRATWAASIPLPFAGAPEHAMLAAIRGASLIWKSLVETGAIFDFRTLYSWTCVSRSWLSSYMPRGSRQSRSEGLL